MNMFVGSFQLKWFGEEKFFHCGKKWNIFCRPGWKILSSTGLSFELIIFVLVFIFKENLQKRNNPFPGTKNVSQFQGMSMKESLTFHENLALTKLNWLIWLIFKARPWAVMRCGVILLSIFSFNWIISPNVLWPLLSCSSNEH